MRHYCLARTFGQERTVAADLLLTIGRRDTT